LHHARRPALPYAGDRIDADGPFLAVLSSESTTGQGGARKEAVLDQPEAPGTFTFECFGDGTVELQLDSDSMTGMGTTTIRAVDCGDGPIGIDPASLGIDPIDLVGAAVTDADGDTAWFPVVRDESTA
jgi:hypothetical protein